MKDSKHCLIRFHLSPRLKGERADSSAGFTLVETLVAVTLLTISIVAPMTLTSMSLSSAYYARDQISAFHLAQEAIETIRHLRDGNILKITLGTETDFMAGIPTDGNAFTVDTRYSDPARAIAGCPSGICRPLTDEGGIYGYGSGTETRFTRSVRVRPVPQNSDEYKVEVTVRWRSGARIQSFAISENMYRWVESGTGL